MGDLVRFGFSRTTSAGSFSVPRDQIAQESARLVADPDIVNAFYYPHPSSAAVWVKGNGTSHAALTEAINNLSR